MKESTTYQAILQEGLVEGEVKEARDRWANMEVNYLLQRVEEYAGVVIMASNLRQNIDEAFVRRIHVMVEFPAPGTEAEL